MKTLRVGIATYESMKARTLAIARGDLRPGARDPKVWFSSMDSMARVLSSRNRELLAVIRAKSPQSLTELAVVSGREKSNLSRTIKTMQRYGLIEVPKRADGKVAPKVAYDKVEMVMELGA
jgi:predicted transcriptional regulator